MIMIEPNPKSSLTKEQLHLIGSRLFIAHGLAKLGMEYLRKVTHNDPLLALLSSIDHEIKEALHQISKAL